MNSRDLHKVPGGMEELKSFVGLVGRRLLPVCSTVIVNVGDAEKPDFVQKTDGASAQATHSGFDRTDLNARHLHRTGLGARAFYKTNTGLREIFNWSSVIHVEHLSRPNASTSLALHLVS